MSNINKITVTQGGVTLLKEFVDEIQAVEQKKAVLKKQLQSNPLESYNKTNVALPKGKPKMLPSNHGPSRIQICSPRESKAPPGQSLVGPFLGRKHLRPQSPDSLDELPEEFIPSATKAKRGSFSKTNFRRLPSINQDLEGGQGLSASASKSKFNMALGSFMSRRNLFKAKDTETEEEVPFEESVLEKQKREKLEAKKKQEDFKAYQDNLRHVEQEKKLCLFRQNQEEFEQRQEHIRKVISDRKAKLREPTKFWSLFGDTTQNMKENRYYYDHLREELKNNGRFKRFLEKESTIYESGVKEEPHFMQSVRSNSKRARNSLFRIKTEETECLTRTDLKAISHGNLKSPLSFQPQSPASHRQTHPKEIFLSCRREVLRDGEIPQKPLESEKGFPKDCKPSKNQKKRSSNKLRGSLNQIFNRTVR